MHPAYIFGTLSFPAAPKIAFSENDVSTKLRSTCESLHTKFHKIVLCTVNNVHSIRVNFVPFKIGVAMIYDYHET